MDFTAGKRGSAGVRRRRAQKVIQRGKRVSALKASGARVRSLVSLGLTPAGGYGAGITGRPWSAVQPLRASAHAALRRHSAGRSVSIDMQIEGVRQRLQYEKGINQKLSKIMASMNIDKEVPSLERPEQQEEEVGQGDHDQTRV